MVVLGSAAKELFVPAILIETVVPTIIVGKDVQTIIVLMVYYWKSCIPFRINLKNPTVAGLAPVTRVTTSSLVTFSTLRRFVISRLAGTE